MTNTFPSLEDAIKMLLDESKEILPELLFQFSKIFSDIAPARLKLLEKVWADISLSRRHALLAHLKNDLEIDLLHNFEVFARPLLNDDDAVTRTYALRLLEDYEGEDLIEKFINIAKTDADVDARSEAISLLGMNVYYGELEEISSENLKKIESCLLQLAKSDERAKVKQRVVEALGFSSREEVPALIRGAWEREAALWKASAVFAMGHSYDRVWEPKILEALLHENEFVRLAATKASGSLALDSSRPILLNALREDPDESVVMASIWSLSEIGGEDVREYLLTLLAQYEDGDGEQVEYIEEALANLDFTEDVQNLDLFDFDNLSEDI